MAKRQQVNVRLSEQAVKTLGVLQKHFAKRVGLTQPLSQAHTIEVILRETAERENVLPAGRWL